MWHFRLLCGIDRQEIIFCAGNSDFMWPSWLFILFMKASSVEFLGLNRSSCRTELLFFKFIIYKNVRFIKVNQQASALNFFKTD
ncbi:hypothetical protein BpHYR1_028388 [Brachionus plicatilis]|uniref:Uncharacterized protein n=1 Tax=Brachionus plicatilis TaxID=10195 RepID=A0A3M7RNE0_BRAPC|nr:hypothetical protein BpHYR1_028388 [Brachionus plicatilis]